MTPIVKKQLEKVYYADLSDFDPATNVYTIRRYSKPAYSVGKMYVVEVSDRIRGRTDTLLAANWNKGTAPQERYLKIYVSKVIGKMMFADCVGFDMERKADTAYIWSGYLPVDDMTQLISY